MPSPLKGSYTILKRRMACQNFLITIIHAVIGLNLSNDLGVCVVSPVF